MWCQCVFVKVRVCRVFTAKVARQLQHRQAQTALHRMAPALWAITVQQGASPQFRVHLAVYGTQQVVVDLVTYCWPKLELHGYPAVSGGESMESCSSCPAGQYCSTEGLARPSGPCAAGFYCPFDFSSTTPYTFLCPKVSQIYFLFLVLVTSMSLFFLLFTKCHNSILALVSHCLIGSLLSWRLCPGPAVSHRGIPAKPRLR